MSQGKVYLLGAGPGDVELLTLKGYRVLKEAQVVVYDSLVGAGVLALVPSTAKTIFVGKRAGHHTMPQERISEILYEEANKGKMVVRLKGGDPFLFGRGGEELEKLVMEGIDFEVIPGITSAISVPAYQGIPITHRNHASCVQIITGHKRAGKENTVDFPAVVKSGGTLLFLMGVTALREICEGLIAAGMKKEMPAALLEQGTTANQKRILGTVETLPDLVEKEGAVTPAVIIVGEVCQLSKEFAWHEKLSLSGKRVVVTRPKELQSELVNMLRKEGAEVLELPTIKIEKCPKKEPWRHSMDMLQRGEMKWVVFTSPSGVSVFFEQLMEEGKDIRIFRNVKIASMGKGTSGELKKRGILPDVMPSTFHGEALAKEIIEKDDTCTGNIFLPRAKIGNQNLVSMLKEAGYSVMDVAIYESVYETKSLVDVEAYLGEGNSGFVAFTSASAVKGFSALLGERTKFENIRCICIGEQTRKVAESFGMKCFVSKEATMESMMEVMRKMGRIL